MMPSSNGIMTVLLPIIVLGIFILMAHHHATLPKTQKLGWGLIALGMLGEMVLRLDPESGLLWMCVLKDLGVGILVGRVLYMRHAGKNCYKGGVSVND